MTTINTSAMYSPSQIGFKGKEKRVIPTIVKNLLEENRSKRIIPEELINDPSKPIKKVRRSDLLIRQNLCVIIK